ncbi:MAG TPA: DUF4249 domain-containing protein [Mucilaginibacter sp.]|nr:DUF4249 domain-containing protein [Mucilaginibacter sp.]
MSLSTMVATGCKKPYNPIIADTNSNYLVVEGVIAPGQDSTFFRLSRTVNVSTKQSFKPELFAQIAVVSDANTSYPLQEMGNGVYASAPLNLDNTHKYRISIQTVDNRTYLSALVEVKTTPEIDSVGYIIRGNGVQIYVNAHDNKAKTRFYRWDFNETWRFHSQFPSNYKLVDGDPVYRPSSEQVYECWGNDTSQNVVLASTTKLTSDVVTQQPITFISSTAEKLETRYSILLKQYALTEAGYTYYANLKKNTEQLGSIFDAQPSSIKGNITCSSNPVEQVLGFVSASTVTKKRIFIDNRDLPAWQAYTYYDQMDCRRDTVRLKDVFTIHSAYTGTPPPYLPLSEPYFAAPIECVDCTLRGTNKQPVFWK